ncbi:phosphatidate cytidylyltransferase, partial [Actinoplanes sp. NPDC051633]
MAYLDPRGDRPSPTDEPGPFAAYWAPAEPEGNGNGGDEQRVYPEAGPEWNAPTAATSTSEAEFALTAGQRGPGKRRAGKTAGRAGRNLPAAIAVGTSLGLMVLASLVIWRPAFLAVIVAAASVGIWEMARALRVTGAHPPLIPLLAGGVLMVGLGWFAGEDAVVLGLVVTVLASILWRLADRPRHFREDFR